MHRKKEGYPDPTAGDAIQEADRPEEGLNEQRNYCSRYPRELPKLWM